MKDIKTINEKYINAMKNKDGVAKSLFSTFKGAIENEIKNNSKKSVAEIIEATAKKFTENAKVNNTDESNIEIELLKEFLPSEVSGEQLKEIVLTVLTENASVAEQYKNGNTNVIGALVGHSMKKCKTMFPGYSVDNTVLMNTIKTNI